MSRRKLPARIVDEFTANFVRQQQSFADTVARFAEWRRFLDSPVSEQPDLIRRESRRITALMADVKPLPDLADTIAEKLAKRLKKSGGRPKKVNQAEVRAFVARKTRAGQKPSAFTKRRAREEFGICERTLRDILKTGKN